MTTRVKRVGPKGILLPSIVLALLTGCYPIAAIDPRAVGPEYDRWETRLAAAPERVFRETLHVLADSGYTARSADDKHGLIATNLRRADNGHGAKWDYRLDFMILPAGDSTRMLIRGEWCQYYDGSLQCHPRTAYHDDWRIVRGIGEVIMARLRQ
jgi:hypothetical protein